MIQSLSDGFFDASSRCPSRVGKSAPKMKTWEVMRELDQEHLDFQTGSQGIGGLSFAAWARPCVWVRLTMRNPCWKAGGSICWKVPQTEQTPCLEDLQAGLTLCYWKGHRAPGMEVPRPLRRPCCCCWVHLHLTCFLQCSALFDL